MSWKPIITLVVIVTVLAASIDPLALHLGYTSLEDKQGFCAALWLSMGLFLLLAAWWKTPSPHS